MRTTSPSRAGDARYRRPFPSPNSPPGWEALVEPRTIVVVENECRSASDRLRGLDARCASDRDDELRQVHQPCQGDLKRAGVVPGGNRGEHGVDGQSSRPLHAAERAVGEQGNAVREAAGDHAVQDVVVFPHAQFHLDRGDLGDAPGLFDLPDVHVAETDRLDVPVALQAVERANARRERLTRVRRVQLIEVKAIDPERTAAGLAGGGQVARAAVGDPAALEDA